MTENRSSTVARAPTVAGLSAEEAFTLPVDRWLRPDAAVPCVQDLPLLLGPEADSQRVVVRVDGRPVSHAALFRHQYLLPDGVALGVGVIGAVATDPDYRRQGHAARCIRELQKRARAEDLDVVVLWDESHGNWYERFGFKRSGREMLHVATRWTLSHLVRPRWVRTIEPRDLRAVRTLHERELASTVRTPEMWLRLLTVPRTEVWVLERNQEIEAYGVLGKGNDLQGCLHEWGGVECALPALLSGIFARQRGLDEISVMSAPWKEEAFRSLEFHGLESTPGALGMMWLPDCRALARRLNRPQLLHLGHDATIRALFDDVDGVPFYLRGLDSM